MPSPKKLQKRMGFQLRLVPLIQQALATPVGLWPLSWMWRTLPISPPLNRHPRHMLPEHSMCTPLLYAHFSCKLSCGIDPPQVVVLSSLPMPRCVGAYLLRVGGGGSRGARPLKRCGHLSRLPWVAAPSFAIAPVPFLFAIPLPDPLNYPRCVEGLVIALVAMLRGASRVNLAGLRHSPLPQWAC